MYGGVAKYGIIAAAALPTLFIPSYSWTILDDFVVKFVTGEPPPDVRGIDSGTDATLTDHNMETIR